MCPPTIRPIPSATPRPTSIRTVVLFLAAGALACLDSTEPVDRGMTDAERAEWVTANAIPVRSVDVGDEDFTDLEPLRVAIGDARIVMLGEQTHGDGTAFEAKVRLVKFLHREMGFDVLAFEAGFFDVREAWKLISAGARAPAAVQQSIFAIWSRSAEVRPVWEYVESSLDGARPLELAGIDPQFTGPVGGGTGAWFVTALESHLGSHESPLLAAAGWPAFREVAERIALQVYRDTPITEDEVASLRAMGPALESGLRAIRDAAPSFEASYWAQLADALLAQGEAWWRRAQLDGPLGYAMERDASMARNLSWIVNEGYAGRKVIVWAHSAHIASDMGSVRMAGTEAQAFAPGYAVLGHLARAEFGDALYSVGFLAGGGSYGFAAVQVGPVPPPAPVPAPAPGSWERFLLGTQHEHAWLDLRAVATEDGAWLGERRLAGPFFYDRTTASWPTVFDAFFFSATMAPATPVSP